jgi:hypothetical protein
MKIDYETAKKIKELLEQGKTYDYIQEAVGVARATISKIRKMSNEEIEDLKEREKEEGKLIEDKTLTTKARKTMLKELTNIIAEQSLENLRDLVTSGQFLQAYYDKVQAENLTKMIQKIKNKEIKEYLYKALIFKFLKGELDREEFLKRFIVICYA